jgi:hypothetical protein
VDRIGTMLLIVIVVALMGSSRSYKVMVWFGSGSGPGTLREQSIGVLIDCSLNAPVISNWGEQTVLGKLYLDSLLVKEIIKSRAHVQPSVSLAS